jgi:hypothetical protein
MLRTRRFTDQNAGSMPGKGRAYFLAILMLAHVGLAPRSHAAPPATLETSSAQPPETRAGARPSESAPLARVLPGSSLLVLWLQCGEKGEPKVTEVPEPVIKKFSLDTTFYKKHLDYKGFSILSSAKVSDEALLEARYLIDKMLGDREDILKAMIKRGGRFMVMAPTEMTTDVPEQRHMKDDPKTDWDKRARGLGGKLSSCGEENLLNLKGDRYNQENILIHEFNHAIHQQGLRDVDPTFDRRLKETYQAAMDKGLWKNTYLTTNHSEYWSEGVQAYFDCMRPQFGANTREKLEKYDEGLFKLVDEVYKQSKFRYVRYDKRKSKGDKADPAKSDK